MWWMDVPIAMRQLCTSTNQRLENDKTLISAIHDFHYEFINVIHPFGDGNGRLARLLHNLLLMKSGFPVVVIKEDEKKDYIQSIIDQEENPESNAFDEFLSEKLAETLTSHLKKQ